jgi:hypothetical protein
VARQFVAASSQKLEGVGAQGAGSTMTISAWVYPDSVADMTVGGPYQGSGASFRLIQFRADGSIQVRAYDGSTAGQASTPASSYVAGAWYHVVGVWAGDSSRSIYLNGGAPVTNTTTISPITLDQFAIGSNGSAGAFMNGRIAEFALWGSSTILTASEIASLAAGVSPLLIRPSTLFRYYPLLGASAPEPDLANHFDLTVTGATAAGHPRMFYPDAPSMTRFVSHITSPSTQTGNMFLVF